MAQIGVVKEAEHDAARRQQAGVDDVAIVRPAGRAIRCLGCVGSARQAAPPMAISAGAMPPARASSRRGEHVGAWASNASHQANSFHGA